MYKNLGLRALALTGLFLSLSSCATSVDWKGDLSTHVKSYMSTFDKYRNRICVSEAEPIFKEKLKRYRGQGYWIPELNDDVDVDTIKTLLPEMDNKLVWIKKQKSILQQTKLPNQQVTRETRELLNRLLKLKKEEFQDGEALRINARKESLRLLGEIQRAYSRLIDRVGFFSNYMFPVDHLKNRKVYDQYREKEDIESTKIANYTFLYRKLLEDGAYDKNHTSSDIYLRTTLDTLHFELREHGFYLSEDARYDLEFVLDKIETELAKGKDKLLERLTEWEDRATRGLDFYRSLTLPENQLVVTIDGKKTTKNQELIREHNRAAEELKEFVYQKQVEVYNFWLKQPELPRAIFVLETILLNEVGTVDGEDALERMDVAKVVMNRLDKPKYLSIGKKEFIYPYLKDTVGEFHLKNERWLNALFKQGEFSFTYYYMGGVSQIFCPDISPRAKKLREQNVKIALQALKVGEDAFTSTRYFSRASMTGRIHMDSIWEDYVPFPERPGLLVSGQEKLLKAYKQGLYTHLYSFKDPDFQVFEVVRMDGKNYAFGEINGVKLFYQHRNPHYFRYFSKTASP